MGLAVVAYEGGTEEGVGAICVDARRRGGTESCRQKKTIVEVRGLLLVQSHGSELNSFLVLPNPGNHAYLGEVQSQLLAPGVPFEMQPFGNV